MRLLSTVTTVDSPHTSFNPTTDAALLNKCIAQEEARAARQEATTIAIQRSLGQAGGGGEEEEEEVEETPPIPLSFEVFQNPSRREVFIEEAVSTYVASKRPRTDENYEGTDCETYASESDADFAPPAGEGEEQMVFDGGVDFSCDSYGEEEEEDIVEFTDEVQHLGEESTSAPCVNSRGSGRSRSALEAFVNDNVGVHTDVITDATRGDRRSSYRRRRSSRSRVDAPFDAEDIYRDMGSTIKKLKQLSNLCLKNHTSGGRDVLLEFRLDIEDLAGQLSRVLGSKDDCFMCMFGNRAHDKTSADKTNELYRILSTYLYKDCSIEAISHTMHSYYVTEIYAEGCKEGLCLPRWSAKGIENHIRNHMLDPRIKKLLNLEKLAAATEVVASQFVNYHPDTGSFTVNDKMAKLYMDFIKLELQISKIDPKQLYGLDDSLDINPANALIDSNITVSYE